MKKLTTTITREEIIGYEAFDGTRFHNEEECDKYEKSAKAAAKRTAMQYLIREYGSWDLLNNDEDALLVFDVRDMDAYKAVTHWAELASVPGRVKFTTDYIGSKVAFFDYGCDDIYFNETYATKESLTKFYMGLIEAAFADKPAPADNT